MSLFVADKTTTTATTFTITATIKYFAGDQRGEKHFHTERKILTEKAEHFLLCRKEEQILFSLTLQFFSTFSRDYLLLQPVALPIALPSSVSMPLTLLRCVDLRFNILCAVELLESISDIYTFSVVEFLVDFFVILAFSGMNLFFFLSLFLIYFLCSFFSIFDSHFLLIFSSIHKCSRSLAISL